jgi:hypothetical protein
MTRIRNSLLIALALCASIHVVWVPAALAVERMPDGSWSYTNGTNGMPRPDPGPSTGEPDVTGNGKAGSTSLQQPVVESPVPVDGVLRHILRFWSMWFPWTWR